MAFVHFEEVGKVYGDGTRAVDGLDLEVADGEFMVLVGPSGCGKSTALRMVAGLEEISEGTIAIGDRVVNNLEPGDRDIAMVFQSYALYPHMTVRENIGFPLKIRRAPKEEIARRVAEAAATLGLADFLDRRPASLSGGQRQRVAMGRAIVRDPKVFLMDEPLSNLDAKLRVQMRAEVARIQQEVGTTTIYVTHDQVEAMTMGDRVAVLRKGELQQVDSPEELFEHPVNLFVATFVGSPAMNLVQADVVVRDGGVACRIGSQELDLTGGDQMKPDDLRSYADRPVALGIRPEHLRSPREGDASTDAGRLRGRVVVTELLGTEALVHLELDARPVLTDEVLEVAADVDEGAVEELPKESDAARTTLLARVDARDRPQPGDTVEVAVGARDLRFFDLDSGRAIGNSPA